jgi:hypothetical protein
MRPLGRPPPENAAARRAHDGAAEPGIKVSSNSGIGNRSARPAQSRPMQYPTARMLRAADRRLRAIVARIALAQPDWAPEWIAAAAMREIDPERPVPLAYEACRQYVTGIARDLLGIPAATAPEEWPTPDQLRAEASGLSAHANALEEAFFRDRGDKP